MPRAEDDRGRKETRRPPAHLPSADLTYREIVDRTNAIVLRWDPDGRIIFMNDFGQRLFGYTQEELAGRSVLELIVPDRESSGRGWCVPVPRDGRERESRPARR